MTYSIQKHIYRRRSPNHSGQQPFTNLRVRLKRCASAHQPSIPLPHSLRNMLRRLLQKITSTNRPTDQPTTHPYNQLNKNQFTIASCLTGLHTHPHCHIHTLTLTPASCTSASNICSRPDSRILIRRAATSSILSHTRRRFYIIQNEQNLDCAFILTLDTRVENMLALSL